MKRSLSIFSLTFTLLSSQVPLLANTPFHSASTSPISSESTNSSSVIAQSTAVLVRVSDNVELDTKTLSSYPTLLPLAAPISDHRGNVVFPANTPVEVKFVSSDGGIRIVAEHIVLPNQQKIPFEASSSLIPAQPITTSSGVDQARRLSPMTTRLGGALGGLIAGGPAGMLIGTLAGQALGIAAGMSTPQKVHLVRIPADSVHSLQLSQSIALGSPSAPAIASPPTNIDSENDSQHLASSQHKAPAPEPLW